MRSSYLFIATAFIFLSCSKEENNKRSYIAYNLNGTSCSGAYRIDDDGDPAVLEAQALHVPGSDVDPEIIILTFNDYADQRTVAFQIPASETTVLATYDHEFLGMGIYHQGGCALVSGQENTLNGLSIDVQKVVLGGPDLFGFRVVEKLEVFFTGIMTYENEMHEHEIHTVEGDLYFDGTF
jgi:hypothetical protein